MTRTLSWKAIFIMVLAIPAIMVSCATFQYRPIVLRYRVNYYDNYYLPVSQPETLPGKEIGHHELEFVRYLLIVRQQKKAEVDPWLSMSQANEILQDEKRHQVEVKYKTCIAKAKNDSIVLAACHNNLAVFYEITGKSSLAEKHYCKALMFSKGDKLIQQQFLDMMDYQDKRIIFIKK